MKEYPPIPRAADAPPRLFEEGHLWILEAIDGGLLRVQLQEAGFLRFGDRERVYDGLDSVPPQYRPAVRHVRTQLDRGALRSAVDDVERVVLVGVATHRRAIAYEFERMPPFLGVEVRDGEEFLTPGAARRVVEQLGLEPVNAVERELPARDFDPGSYAMPASAWYDGRAAGVLVRNKRGDRAKLCRAVPDVETVDADAEALADRYVTPERFERLARRLEADGEPVTVETLQERTVESIAREHHAELPRAVETGAFRSAVAARTREFLTERYG